MLYDKTTSDDEPSLTSGLFVNGKHKDFEDASRIIKAFREENFKLVAKSFLRA